MQTRFVMGMAFYLLTSVVSATEPWADSSLPVRDGMLGWYDASRLEAAAKSEGLPAPQPDSPVERWPDASGHKRDLRQTDEAARPGYLAEGDFRGLRFDGKQTHLQWKQDQLTASGVSGFLVIVPHANRSEFTGLLAASASGSNDSSSGFNFDLGPQPTDSIDTLNLESVGTAGWENLLLERSRFGKVLRLAFTITPEPESITVWANGKLQGHRERPGNAPISLEELLVGARHFGNGGPPVVSGFFEGDVAELLLYDRQLTAADRASVEQYLEAKYGSVGLPPAVSSAERNGLVRVKSPPPVQMFVPGFEVRQLPIALTNLNNVLYRPDGKLVGLGYNGDVLLLSDSDGDGLEDKVEMFWENKGEIRAPIGMALRPGRPGRGMAVVVAAKGRCSLLEDNDNDDRADGERVIASGWTELPHGVDAVGIAVDPKDDSVFFGLGCQSFGDAYGANSATATPYSLQSERGTIMRIAPDFQSREVRATGVRFPVALRFNKLGDLFCTDQEGATWLPNGNPFDELLQIQTGRHYGFPPRHPKHLPNVIDEPSVFDDAPQHQCTCGFNFNDPVNGGPVFGPEWWHSDALMTGYSRGKLYRTKLFRTTSGYVAQNQLIASLPMLPVDACVSPAGDLVIAVHGGGPDWGTGAAGQGKFFKIATLPNVARPMFAWAQSLREVRIAFDAPLQPGQLKDLGAGATIESGPAVAAGDRFEFLWPGYKAVHDQKAAPRTKLAVHSVQVSPDRKTLILATDPHPERTSYALTLKGLGRPPAAAFTGTSLPQVPETDLAYSLDGVWAEWRRDQGTLQAIWLPHLDLAVAAALTRPSQSHADFWSTLNEPGALSLQTTLDLNRMLRPEVQPGSQVDSELPQEQVTLTFRSSSPFELTVDDVRSQVMPGDGDRSFEATVSTSKPTVALGITLPTGESPPVLNVSWKTAEDDRERAFPLRRLSLPWAPTAKSSVVPILASDLPELQGGSWSRGKAVFFGEMAGCYKCHRIHGTGAKIGPDLSNLPHRDYGSVLRDIVSPSFAINPDYLTYLITTTDGRVLTGTVRTEGPRLHVSDSQGRTTTLLNSDVELMQASATSIMPDGLTQKIGPGSVRDLLTFVLTAPPRMASYGPLTPPEPRTWDEVSKVLEGSRVPSLPLRKKIVLVAAAKDHGPGSHDYPAWQSAWSQLFKLDQTVDVTTAKDWPSPEDLKTADVLVFYQRGQWTAERAHDIDAFLQRGGGLVYLHFAVNGAKEAPAFAQRIGLAYGEGSTFRHGPIDLGFNQEGAHVIGRNFDRVQFHDESYWRLTGDPSRINWIGSGREDNAEQPLFWTLEPSQGRVFVSILGHFSWTFDDPLFRVLVLRGIAWSAREPVDRFNDLVLPGARIRYDNPAP